MTPSLDLPLRQLFNERSLRDCGDDRHFRDLMFGFLELSLKLRKAGFALDLTLSRRISMRMDADAKRLFDWLFGKSDDGADRERKNVLRGLFTRGLLTEEILPPERIADEILLDGAEISNPDWVPALVASHYLGLDSVSVHAESGHEDGCYALAIRSVCEDDGDAVVVTSGNVVRSISDVRRIPSFLETIRLRSIQELKARDDRSDVVAQLFPNLEFSTVALAQLADRDFTHANEVYVWFCKMLFEIDYAWGRVRDGECADFFTAFGDVAYIARTESGPTREAFREEHTFAGQDGVRHICFSHCKNKAFNKRVYFEVPDDRCRTVFIGSIGGHLPTMRNR